jgi:hypothetical protein
MTHYYFDLRDGHALSVDDEGLELPNMDAVQEEAVQALASMAKDKVQSAVGKPVAARDMVIEARDDDGPVLRARFVFEFERLQ